MKSSAEVVVVTNRMDPAALELLRANFKVVANTDEQPWTREELLTRAENASGVVAFMTDRMDDAFLSKCPHLKIVSCALKGYDNFDVEAFKRRGVWLSIVPDLLSMPTAELTVGLMIAAARTFHRGDRFVRSGNFRGWRAIWSGSAISGSVVGIVGMGSLGGAIARCLKGFDAQIVYHDVRQVSSDQLKEPNLTRVEFDELLSRSDFIVLAAPLLPQTTHIIDSRALTLIKHGAILINTARGSLVDEEAVAEALKSGVLSAYAADVFELEDQIRPSRPLKISPQLLDSDRTIFTPHIGSAIPTVRREIELFAANSIVQFFDGVRPPPGAVFQVGRTSAPC